MLTISLGRVFQNASLFNYTLTNSSYSQNNNPAIPFIPNYNHTTNSPFLPTASHECSRFLRGTLPDACTSLFTPGTLQTLYNMCVDDVMATYLAEYYKLGVETFVQICSSRNSSIGNVGLERMGWTEKGENK